jgi:diaminopimelate epimerase
MLGEDAECVVSKPLEAGGRQFSVTAVSMGNPHAVIFDRSVDAAGVERYGPLIERHPAFPQRTNVHFVQVCGPSELAMRTWERGAGVTLACGTGACATLVAAALNGLTGRSATIQLPGGDLQIEWAADDHVLMTGPAEEVFAGSIDL